MTELKKLARLLKQEGIPFIEYEDQIIYYDPSVKEPYDSEYNYISDVVCHPRSHGYEKGLLEMLGRYESILDYMDLPIDPEETYGKYIDEIKGYLTAEEAFEIWKKHFYDNKK